MPFLELFDETLDINSTENYDLSVQISTSGLAFCILDTIRNKYILIRSAEPDDNKMLTADAIREMITRDDFLVRRFRKVNIVLPTQKFTLVPSPLFDPGKKDDYFTYNHTVTANDIIAANRLTDPDAYTIFAVNRELYEIPMHFWPAAFPFHHTKPLLNLLSHQSKSVQGHYVHVHLEKEFFNLLVYDKGLLRFSNTFTFRNISDILYYVLNTFKTMDISHSEHLHFSGLTSRHDDLWSGFSMYLKNLEFVNPSGNFTFSYVFNEVELHRYINLFSVASCG